MCLLETDTRVEEVDLLLLTLFHTLTLLLKDDLTTVPVLWPEMCNLQHIFIYSTIILHYTHIYR